MDNVSSVGGENFSSAPERLERDFGPSEFEQRVEQRQFGGQAELGRGALEAMPGMTSEVGTEAADLGYGDANAQMTELNGQLLGTDLENKQRKHGDKMDADMVEKAQRVGAEIERNPHQGLTQLNALRKEYMKMYFNRILGERNDGSKDASLNVTGNQAQGKAA